MSPAAWTRAEPAQDVREDVQRAAGRELALLLEHVGERLALEQLHREIQRAVGQATDVVGRDAVGMIDLADRERLALEPRPNLGRRRERRMEDLDGDLAAQPDVRRAKHEAHAAATERPVEAIPAVDDHTDQLGAVSFERHRRVQ